MKKQRNIQVDQKDSLSWHDWRYYPPWNYQHRSGSRKPRNFRHIVLNNGAHDSVGGQPTVGLQTDIPSIARACGYEKALSVRTVEELRSVLLETEKRYGPILIEARLCKGARPDLGRPRTSPIENKIAFMKTLRSDMEIYVK